MGYSSAQPGTVGGATSFIVSENFIGGTGTGTNHFAVDLRAAVNWPTNLTSSLNLGAAPPWGGLLTNTHTLPVVPFDSKLVRWEVWVTYPTTATDGSLFVYKIEATNDAVVGAVSQLAVVSLDGTGSSANRSYDLSIDITSGGNISAGDSFLITRKPATSISQNDMRVRSTLIFSKA